MKRILFLLLVVSLSVMGCKKEQKEPAKAPTVATGSISNITTTSFDCEGNVSADGGAAVTDRGVCYAMSSSPTISNDKVSGGSGTGSFKVSIGNLTPGKVYHARAYATNSAGTAYGQEVKVTLVKVVEEDLPSITLTTKKAVGEKIKLRIDAEPADRPNVWIDLNNNKVKDAGESVTAFGSFQEYKLGSQTITVHGKVTRLDCDYNSLTSLDVSKNTALTSLGCYSNSLTSLDVSKNTALRGLYCSSNSLTSLDVSKNTALTDLVCSSNSLTSLDVSKNTALTYLSCSSNSLTSLDVSKNTALTRFSCSNNLNLSSLKISSSINEALWVNHCKLSTETLNEIFTTLPDVKGQTFGEKKIWIANNPGTDACDKKIATDKGWKLDVGDTPPPPAGYSMTMTTKRAVGEKIELWINAEPEDQADVWIDLNNNKVKDAGESVTAFGSFQEYKLGSRTITVYGKATELLCSSKYSNKFTSLDVSKNKALTRLSCHSNSLTSLDVSKNTALTKLVCYSNSLTSLDVSKNTALTVLSCYSNSLTSLDVSKNTALTVLSCSSNSLTSLDVSKNTALQLLFCYSNSLTSLDVSKNTALTDLSCSSNSLTSLDVSKNTALTELYCDENSLTSLDVSKNTKLEWLYCDENSLTSLDVSKNTALTDLRCSYNSLTSLDVSKNTALTGLSCSSNSLTSLDVSKNIALKKLYCHSNSLTSLDVSKNTALEYLYCSNNLNLSSLKISSSINDALWVNHCQLSAETLNEIFTTLPDVKGQSTGKKKIWIKGNPGTDACNKKIAEDKGWTVNID